MPSLYNLIPTSLQLQPNSNQFTTKFQPVYNLIPTSLQPNSNQFTT